MISVIIPMYNPGELLCRMIESLQRQTYRDLEILLIDDGSTDGTEQFCNDIVKQDNRFQYYYQENAGVSAARNLGLQLAGGEFIAFLDADDRIDDNYFAELLWVCQNADIAVCDVIIEDATRKIISKFSLPGQVLSSKGALNYLLKRQNINSGPYAKLFRKVVISSLRFPALSVYEDVVFVMQAFVNARSIRVTDHTAYHYCQNMQSAMHKAVKKLPMDIVTATDTIMGFIIKHNDLDEQCVYITLSHLYQYVQLAIKQRKENLSFLKACRRLFQKYGRVLLRCRAFPRKEKVVYILFMFFGLVYQNHLLG